MKLKNAAILFGVFIAVLILLLIAISTLNKQAEIKPVNIESQKEKVVPVKTSASSSHGSNTSDQAAEAIINMMPSFIGWTIFVVITGMIIVPSIKIFFNTGENGI